MGDTRITSEKRLELCFNRCRTLNLGNCASRCTEKQASGFSLENRPTIQAVTTVLNPLSVVGVAGMFFFVDRLGEKLPCRALRAILCAAYGLFLLPMALSVYHHVQESRGGKETIPGAVGLGFVDLGIQVASVGGGYLLGFGGGKGLGTLWNNLVTTTRREAFSFGSSAIVRIAATALISYCLTDLATPATSKT